MVVGCVEISQNSIPIDRCYIETVKTLSAIAYLGTVVVVSVKGSMEASKQSSP